MRERRKDAACKRPGQSLTNASRFAFLADQAVGLGPTPHTLFNTNGPLSRGEQFSGADCPCPAMRTRSSMGSRRPPRPDIR